jgi:hypothetical protein
VSVVIVYVGGTMHSERERVASAAVDSITLPALDGLPEETYRRLDQHDQPTVRFGFVSTRKEGTHA